MDGFHPDFDANVTAPFDACGVDERRKRVHHIRASELDADTAQTDGLQRFAAISGKSVGAQQLWMGETYIEPDTASGNHHHGESETAIYVRSGHPEFVFH